MPHPPLRQPRLEPPHPRGWTIHDDVWDTHFEALKAIALQNPNGLPRRFSRHDAPPKLRNWVSIQRMAYLAGNLAKDRVQALESLPGFCWRARNLNGMGLHKPFKPRESRLAAILGQRIALPWLLARLNASTA